MSYILEAIKKSEEEKLKKESSNFLNPVLYKSINKNYMLYARNKFLILTIALIIFLGVNLSVVLYWYFFHKNKSYTPPLGQDKIAERQVKIQQIVKNKKQNQSIDKKNLIANIEDIEAFASKEFADLYIDNLLNERKKPKKKRVSKPLVDINQLSTTQKKLEKEFKFKLDHITNDAVGGLGKANDKLESTTPLSKDIDEVQLIEVKPPKNVAKASSLNDFYQANIEYKDLPYKIKAQFEKIKFSAHIYLQGKKNNSWVRYKSKNYTSGTSIKNFKIIDIKQESVIFKYKDYIFEHSIII